MKNKTNLFHKMRYLLKLLPISILLFLLSCQQSTFVTKIKYRSEYKVCSSGHQYTPKTKILSSKDVNLICSNKSSKTNHNSPALSKKETKHTTVSNLKKNEPSQAKGLPSVGKTKKDKNKDKEEKRGKALLEFGFIFDILGVVFSFILFPLGITLAILGFILTLMGIAKKNGSRILKIFLLLLAIIEMAFLLGLGILGYLAFT